jgi:hypothetical protein
VFLFIVVWKMVYVFELRVIEEIEREESYDVILRFIESPQHSIYPVDFRELLVPVKKAEKNGKTIFRFIFEESITPIGKSYALQYSLRNKQKALLSELEKEIQCSFEGMIKKGKFPSKAWRVEIKSDYGLGNGGGLPIYGVELDF